MKKRMTRENTKAYANKPRFPRLILTPKTKWVARILHVTYNKIARGKNYRYKNFNYDVYKTKRGWKAKQCFIYLAEKLQKNNIDAALYVKVMARFGKYKNAMFMPSPVWLAKDKQIERFKWVYRKERKSYPLELDWKKAMNGWSELDIYSSIRESGDKLFEAASRAGADLDASLLLLWNELSPWFKVVYVMESRTWKDFRHCWDFLRRYRLVRKTARKALKKSQENF